MAKYIVMGGSYLPDFKNPEAVHEPGTEVELTDEQYAQCVHIVYPATPEPAPKK